VRSPGLRAREAAEALGLSAETLRRKAKAGQIKAERRGGRWVYSAREIETTRRVGSRWLTSSEAARTLRRSTKTVNSWADRGVLPFRRGRGGWRWFARTGVVALARAIGGRRRLSPAHLAGFLPEV
jgi:excisionase family DNA binding protein